MYIWFTHAHALISLECQCTHSIKKERHDPRPKHVCVAQAKQGSLYLFVVVISNC